MSTCFALVLIVVCNDSSVDDYHMNPSYACSFCMVGIPKDSLKYLSNFTNVCLHSDVSHLQVWSVILYSNFLPVTNQHVKERLCLNPACPFRISYPLPSVSSTKRCTLMRIGN